MTTTEIIRYCLAKLKTIIDAKWHARKYTFTATIPTAGWSGSGISSIKVNVTGILATDEPVVDVNLTGNAENDAKIVEAWAHVTDIVTADSSITVYADAVPEIAIPIHMMEVRNQ